MNTGPKGVHEYLHVWRQVPPTLKAIASKYKIHIKPGLKVQTWDKALKHTG